MSQGSVAPLVRAVVVGGGPAGLIAAEVLARDGMAVTVHEHMASVGRKLLLAGRSGLNLTHSEPLAPFIDRYQPGARRLSAAVRSFAPADLRAWSSGLGHDTFVGSTGRVFPTSWKATPLLRAWLRATRRAGCHHRDPQPMGGVDRVRPDHVVLRRRRRTAASRDGRRRGAGTGRCELAASWFRRRLGGSHAHRGHLGHALSIVELRAARGLAPRVRRTVRRHTVEERRRCGVVRRRRSARFVAT